MSYFKHFPQTTFQGKSIADITRKAKINKVVTDNALDYMSYTIQEGERPEDIAYNYYDDPSLTWLVLMSNNIIDMYTEWPCTTQQVESNIIAKYTAKSGTTGTAVLDWAKNATISANIIHYKSQFDNSVKLNRTSFVSLGNSHTVTARNILAGNEYTIQLLGDISDDDWELITGAKDGTTFTVGYKFTAQINGTNILFADTAKVTGSSLTNPAREFIPVRAYDYEWEANEERRNIQLINKGYVATIQEQLETILKDG